MVYENILETIGRTPIVRLNHIVPSGSAEVLAKVESFNPLHSVKDRIALAMVEEAERRGELVPGKVILEPTSGNTGIGLAMVTAAKGYKLILTMPETMSVERRNLLKAFGAEIVLTPGPEGMNGAVNKAKEIQRSRPDLYVPLQFDNPANPNIHEITTAQEILEDVPDIDAFVAGVGTGGTITGVARALRSRGLTTKIIAVEPASSPVLSGGRPGPHRIQGIGAGFVPSVLDVTLLDRIVQVTNEEAFAAARLLARKEGILAGISSGAAVHAALQVSQELGPGRKVVVILPDTGERYLSTGLFE
ncbi:MAG: cysteine synthase A [Methanomassiliicoccales archaeon PtaU1.Bin124]|nr:MAG: cysteine synthase A [Methanomassiliicoccales archaeon PtaU1.Bin124]